MITITLTPKAKAFLRGLSEALGVSPDAVVEMAIRRMAKAEGVEEAESEDLTPLSEPYRASPEVLDIILGLNQQE